MKRYDSMVYRYESRRPSIVRVYLCLGTIGNLLQSSRMEDCFMPMKGTTYIGTLNITMSGKTCQRWDTIDSYKIYYTIRKESFPDGTTSAAQNFCRNPDPTERYKIWCYTTEYAAEWEYCDACAGKRVSTWSNPFIETDYGSCMLPSRGSKYRGKVAHSRSYFQCAPWVRYVTSNLIFPDETAKEARNYCRNPTYKDAQGPWCFVDGPRYMHREYCDVCSTTFPVKLMKRPGIHFANHFAIRRLPEFVCIYWCIEIQSCTGVDVVPSKDGCNHRALNGGDIIYDGNWDLYTITRVCPATTNGSPGYFVTFLSSKMNSGVPFVAPAFGSCDRYCAINVACVAVDWSIHSTECMIHDVYSDEIVRDQLSTLHIILHCDPLLKVQIMDYVQSDTKELPAAPTKETVAPIIVSTPPVNTGPAPAPTPAPTPPQIVENTRLETTEKPEKSVLSGSVLVVIVLIVVFAIVGIAASVIIRASNRKKAETAAKDERAALVAKMDKDAKDKATKKSLIRLKSISKIGKSKEAMTAVTAAPTEGVPTPAVTAAPTEEVPTPDVTAAPTEGVPTPDVTAAPTEGVPTPDITAAHAEGVPTTDLTAAPTEGVTTPDVTAAPTEGVPRPDVTAAPTEGVPAPDVTAAPTEGVPTTDLTAAPTEGAPTPDVTAAHTEGVPTTDLTAAPTEGVTTPVEPAIALDTSTPLQAEPDANAETPK